jgi:hypothetical protein
MVSARSQFLQFHQHDVVLAQRDVFGEQPAFVLQHNLQISP